MGLRPSDILSPGATTVVLGLTISLVVFRLVSRRKVHPNEPKVLPPWIPFVGHLIGMAVYGGRYIKRLGLLNPNEPIFTLPVPGSRIYVVTDPSLAASVQRNVKAMSFTPLIPDITKRVLGLDKETVKSIRQNLDPEPGEPRGFLADAHDVVYDALGPGHYLNTLSCEASQELCAQLCAFANLQEAGPFDLLQWIRHLVTVGTAKYLYGPQNPIAEDPKLEDAFWAFDNGLGGLLMGIMPSITASEAYRGRERMVAAFVEYFEAGRLDGAAKISKDRVRVEQEHGMSQQMIARSALSFFFAGIVNTTTTTFWVVLRLFADKTLLATVRQEVVKALKISEEKGEPNSLSIAVVKDSCPTLLAVFRESLRIGSENFSVRLIKEDVMLAERYFLKKDSVVQIAGGVLHADKNIWGDDVEKFNPQRFLTQKARSGGFHPAAFRGFGGGKTLCPGRHFATNEILVFAALIVHGFDMTAPDGSDIVVPLKNDCVMPVHILEPKSDDCPRVIIRPRKEAQTLRGMDLVV